VGDGRMSESKGIVDTGKSRSPFKRWTRYAWSAVGVVTTTVATLSLVKIINIPLVITVLLWVLAGCILVFQIVHRLCQKTLTPRKYWKEAVWILVNVIFVTFATIGLVKTINIPQAITVLLWVLAGYVFVFQIVRRLWDELRRKIEGFAEPLREIASQKALYTVFKMVVPETRAEEVLEGLGVPILRRTMDLQRTHPLETRLKMFFRGDREEIPEVGELLVVTRTISWTASLLKAETTL
jgi:hypothetical protein